MSPTTPVGACQSTKWHLKAEGSPPCATRVTCVLRGILCAAMYLSACFMASRRSALDAPRPIQTNTELRASRRKASSSWSRDLLRPLAPLGGWTGVSRTDRPRPLSEMRNRAGAPAPGSGPEALPRPRALPAPPPWSSSPAARAGLTSLGDPSSARQKPCSSSAGGPSASSTTTMLARPLRSSSRMDRLTSSARAFSRRLASRPFHW
mmetsp:Transcript_26178/g.87684  ORF Transcript_26178/g.87684 Transcript_26178/m.87684 type:complete len:207 (-) Transcript_26178:641-1261(-)